jgi:mannuronan synthase
MSIVDTTPKIAHDSERQRQFARLRIPLSIKIAGQRYDVIDWSVGGISVRAANLNLTVGNSYSGRVVLPFDDFEVELKVRFEVCYTSADGPRMGCRLVEQSPTQLAILQYMVRAYIAGEIVHMGDIMNVVQRGAGAAVRELPKLSAEEGARQRLRRWAMGGAIVVGCAAMLALLVGSMYEQLYLVDARSGVVTTDLIQIAAPQGGRLTYGAEIADGEATSGGLLATVTTPGGSTYFVESPCDCRIVDVLTAEDSQVGVGTNLLLLAPGDAEVRVSALVPYEDALRLREGMQVDLEYTAVDGSFEGEIAAIDIRRQLSALGQPVLDDQAVISAEVTIVPTEPVTSAWIGKPVAVTIDVFGATWLGRLLGAGN